MPGLLRDEFTDEYEDDHYEDHYYDDHYDTDDEEDYADFAFEQAVQKGRIPKSPLEGSVIDQLSQANNGHVSTYTNLLLRADNMARLQQQHHHHHQQQLHHQQHHQQQQQQQQNPICVGSFSGNSSSGQDGVYELAIRLLLNAVEWARNVPFFSALPGADQVALLKAAWSELFILSTSQHCSNYQLTVKSLVPNSVKQEAFQMGGDNGKRNGEGVAAGSKSDSFKVFEDLVDRFKTLHTDAAEFSCLKALVLFNPDTPGIANPSLIENLQEKAQAALEEYLRPNHNNHANRFGKLLLRLPALRLIRPITIETLFFSRPGISSSVDNIVGSMLLFGSNGPPNAPYLGNGNQNGSHSNGFGMGGVNVSNSNGSIGGMNNSSFFNNNHLGLNSMSALHMANQNGNAGVSMGGFPNGLHHGMGSVQMQLSSSPGMHGIGVSGINVNPLFASNGQMNGNVGPLTNASQLHASRSPSSTTSSESQRTIKSPTTTSGKPNGSPQR